MNKTIYIGEVPAEYLEMGTEELFQYEGQFYYFELTFNFADGCAQLRDTCNRMIPFDYTNYAEIAVGLDTMATLQQEYQDLSEEIEDFQASIPATTRVAVNPDAFWKSFPRDSSNL